MTVMVKDPRTIKMTLMLSVEEQAMMQRLAQDEGVSTAHVIRSLVKKAFARRFPDQAATVTPATIGGLIDDLTARVHYTTPNIAERMAVSAGRLRRTLQWLAKKKGVPIEGHDVGTVAETWALLKTKDELLTRLAKVGVDLADPLLDETDD